MWKTVESNTSEKPLTVDEVSSQVYIYVRRAFEKIPNYNLENKEAGTCWRYKEQKIKKEDWEVYQTLIFCEERITDIQMAICGLYEMMIGGGVVNNEPDC